MFITSNSNKQNLKDIFFFSSAHRFSYLNWRALQEYSVGADIIFMSNGAQLLCIGVTKYRVV